MNAGHPVLVAADVASVLVIITAWAQLVPPLAAAAAFVFYCIQIYKSEPVQRWLLRRRQFRESLERAYAEIKKRDEDRNVR